MAAIITSEFRKNARALFKSDLETTDNYFIGLGKTDSWPDTVDSLDNQVTEYSRQFSAPLPVDTVLNKEDVLQNLMVMVRTTGTQAEIFNVIPRNNWAFDRIYKTYDPTDPKCFDYETIDGVAYYPCYVTSNDRIYLCLSNVDGNGEVTPSSVAIPSGVGADAFLSFGTTPQPISNGEGYIWTLVTFLDEDSKFYTDQFVDYTTPQSTDYVQISNSTGGLIYDFKVVNGGATATTIPATATTEIRLKGTKRNTETGALEPVDDVVMYKQGQVATTGDSWQHFEVVINNGIESVKYKPDPNNNTISYLKNYVTASVVVETENGFNNEIDIVPLLLPEDGIGRRPDDDLPSFYAGIAVDFIGEVDGEAPVGYNVDVRQISLIKNPVRNSTGDNAGVAVRDDDTNAGLYTGPEAYDALKYIQLDDSTDLQKDYIGRDFIIEQGTVNDDETGARAWLDYADSINNRLYYHQNSSPQVNLKKFVSNGDDSGQAPNVTVTSIAGYSDPDDVYLVNTCNEAEYMSGTGEVIFYENRKPINRNFNQTDEVKLVIQF